MKHRFIARALPAACGIALLVIPATQVVVQGASDTNAPGPAPPPQAASVKLSPDAAEVLKLAQAQVGEDTLMAFIANSGKTYPLSANDVIYLRNAGVSDRVLAAMLTQQSRMAPAVPTATPSAQAVAPPQVTQVYTVPTTTYIASPPVYTYYGYPGWYGWPYYYPGVSLSFGFGGYYYGGPYHGGFGHGPYGGGGFHGGHR